MASNVRQNFNEACEEGINKQINLELYAMYSYLSMVSSLFSLIGGKVCDSLYLQASYYDRHDVALPGVAKFFKKSAQEEFDHAQKFIAYQNKRGGKVVLNDLRKPAKEEWGSALEGMKVAQELERTVNQAILDLHKTSDQHGDFQVRSIVLLHGPFPVLCHFYSVVESVSQLPLCAYILGE